MTAAKLINPFARFSVSDVWREGHPAVDYRTPAGTPFVSPGDGIYRRRPSELRDDIEGQAGHYGDLLLPDGRSIRFCHLDRHVAADGAKVKRGVTVLGETGNTGTSSGPHMHTTGFLADGTRWDWTRDAAAAPAGVPTPLPASKRMKGRNMSLLLLGVDKDSAGTKILVVASPGVWDRYALGNRATLEQQFGPALGPFDLTTMESKRAQYLSAFDVKVTVAGVVADVDEAAIAKAVNDDAAKRLSK